MLFKNVASQKIHIYAYDSTTGAPKTGDAANITAYVSLDGTANAIDDTNPAEVDSTNMPGVYVFDLTAAETNCNSFALYAKSATSNIRIEPIIGFTTGAANSLSVNTGTFTNDAITAAAIAAGAIDNATLAADIGSTAYATNIIALALRKALDEIKLDHLIAVADSDDVVDNSVIGKLASTDGDWSKFVDTTDALQSIRDRGDSAWITATGFSTFTAATDKVFLGDGAHGGAAATFAAKSIAVNNSTGSALSLTSSSAEYAAVTITNLSANGLAIYAKYTDGSSGISINAGRGITIEATLGDGIYVASVGGNGDAIHLVPHGTGLGINSADIIALTAAAAKFTTMIVLDGAVYDFTAAALAAGGISQQEVRDAMKLAPTAGDPAAGSVDKHLDDLSEPNTYNIDANVTIITSG